MKKDNITLKSYFETGDYPSEAEFVDLIDSFLNIEENDTVTGITDNGDNTYTFHLLVGQDVILNGGSIPEDIPIENILGLQASLDLLQQNIDNVPSATGLEAVSDGSDTGWRLVGEDLADHANIGSKAIDFTVFGSTGNAGATNFFSFAQGQEIISSGQGSVGFGNNSIASAQYAFTVGNGNTASGSESATIGFQNNATGNRAFAVNTLNTASGASSSAFGVWNFARATGEFSVGQYSTDYTPNGTNDRAFNVGAGTSDANRVDALTILRSGEVLAPNIDNSKITAASDKVLITKEYADENYKISPGYITGTPNLKTVMGMLNPNNGSVVEIELLTVSEGFGTNGKGTLNIKSNTNTDIVNSNPYAVGGGRAHLLAGNGKAMLGFQDNWVRLNPFNDFSSGIFGGTGIFRTDGEIQMGQDGGKFKVATSGAVTSASTMTATSFVQSSDVSLKRNITPLANKPIKVDWASYEMEGKKRYGVIGQELEKHHPEFVITGQDGLKAVSYIDLLVAKNAELESRIEKLEGLNETA